MAPHSSTLAWKILWMEEPGRLQSMGSLRVGHDGATLLSLFTFMHWRRKWQPTSVFLGFSCGSAGKESTSNVGDLGSIPGFGRSPEEGKYYPLQYSGLEIHGLYSPCSHKQLDMIEPLSLSRYINTIPV